MSQFTETYRVKISAEMKQQLIRMKDQYRIVPTAFIRQAIAEKIARDLPSLKAKRERIRLPF